MRAKAGSEFSEIVFKNVPDENVHFEIKGQRATCNLKSSKDIFEK